MERIYVSVEMEICKLGRDSEGHFLYQSCPDLRVVENPTFLNPTTQKLLLMIA